MKEAKVRAAIFDNSSFSKMVEMAEKMVVREEKRYSLLLTVIIEGNKMSKSLTPFCLTPSETESDAQPPDLWNQLLAHDS